MNPGAGPRAPWRGVPGLFAILVPAIALGSESSLGSMVGVLLPIAGVVAAFVWGWFGRAGARDGGVVPLLLALSVETVTAPIRPSAELLAAAAALSLLYWLARDGATAARPSDTISALSLPTLAIGIAVGTSVLLPTGTAVIAAAAVLVLATLLLLALAFRAAEVVWLDRPSRS